MNISGKPASVVSPHIAAFATAMLLPLGMVLGGWGFLEYYNINASNPVIYLGKRFFTDEDWMPIIAVWLFAPPLALGLLIRLAFGRKHKPLYGAAQFATRNDIKRMGLLKKKRGIIIGSVGWWIFRRCLYDDTQLSAIAVAPPRSWKSRGLAIPNLLSYQGSAIVTDIKSELFAMTAGFRSKYQAIKRFSPTEPNSDRYNPFSRITDDPIQRQDELQIIWHTIIPDRKGDNPIWTSGARDLGLALSNMLLDLDEPGVEVTFGRVYRTARHTADLGDFLERKLREDAGLFSSETLHGVNGFLAKAPKERSGVLSQLTTALSLWANPLVDEATSATDFDPADFRRRATTLYICIPPKDLDRMAPLVNLFLEQSLNRLLDKPPVKDKEPHKILLLLDEMTAFGKLNKLAATFQYLASYNIIVFPLIQSIGQLVDAYGQHIADSLLSGSKYRIFFSIADTKTAKYVSDHLGERTLTAQSHSRQANAFWQMPVVNRQSVARPLRSIAELLKMPPKKQIILVRDESPILCKKVFFDKDKEFIKRTQAKLCQKQTRSIEKTEA